MAVFSLWTFATLLFILQKDIAVKGHPTQNLHHHMTKREIEHFFGVDDHDKVPEYDIASPYQSNDQGDFVSYSLHPSRNKRDAEPHEPSFYKFDAFGSKHHLKLRKNEHLMDPNLTIVSRNSDGTTTKHPAPPNTFYLGHVVSDPRSTVAISNDGGLTGLVKTSRDTLFVHPLPLHLAKHVTSNEDITPHLVYRRSLKENGVLCDTTGGAEETIRLKRSSEPEDLLDKMSDSDPPVIMSDSVPLKFKTLKAALLYPKPLKDKYSKGRLKWFLGGVHNYLLVLANMVAAMYQDPSFGQTKITYVVTTMREINTTEYGFKLNDGLVMKLGRITSKLRASKPSYDVFSYVSNAIASSAVATYNFMCRLKPIGNVNSDKGLQTALHIAHEIGHNMGLGHVHGHCAGHIMNGVIPGGEHATEWSKCSRDYIQKFLADSKRSWCLDDGPTVYSLALPPKFRNRLPGHILGGNEQCETHYGAGWKRHDTHQCKHLTCHNGHASLSQNIVVADGTRCGHHQWCIKGKCVEAGNVTSPPGVWSEWTYSPCNKKCGTGFEHRSRHCIKPEFGKHCEGHHRESKICNVQPCPNGVTPSEFRRRACVNRPDGFTVAYIRGGRACETWCRTSYAAKPVGSMPDGTPCTHAKASHAGVCLHRTCIMVGCDGVVGGRKVLDRCGLCGGNGTRCSKIYSTYTDNPALSGPDNAALIAELPLGTRSAFFQMTADSHHYLGVQDASGTYLVGAHLGGSANKPAAGTMINYYHRRGRKPGKDLIRILNPTNAVLRVVYIKKANNDKPNPGVRYQYVVPSQLTGSASGDDFAWKPDGSWSGCSRSCAYGIKTRTKRCIRKDDNSIVDDSACLGPAKETEPCNTQPCKAKWVLNWTPCSKTCGQGKQVQTYKCLEQITETQSRETNTCTVAKPAQSSIPSRLCNFYPCPAEWSVGNWSECPFKCAVGTIRRSVSCSRIDEAGRLTVIADVFCRFLDKKPASEAKCNDDNPCGPRPSHCPADHVCSNGGQCQPDPAGYRCVCDRGFTGMECEIKLNPCDNNPCLNGGSCSPGVNHHYDHTCQCKEQFTGKNCETAVTACDSNPCLNNGTCTDNGAYDNYICACPDGFVGEQCQVSIPTYLEQLGCYATPIGRKQAYRKKLKTVLGSSNVIEECARAAYSKGFTYFAVRNRIRCWSDKYPAVRYAMYGPSPNCKDGVGLNSRTNMVYRFKKVPLGCYRSTKPGQPKLFNFKLRTLNTKKGPLAMIDDCAMAARAKRFTYFAVRNSVCWSDQNEPQNYAKYGHSPNCKDGVGLHGINAVYKFDL